MQLVRGHALVIPKRHVEPPETLTHEESSALLQEAERLRVCLLKHFGKGVDIWQKSRPYLPEGHNGTKVDHLHFHIIPSEPGNEIYDKGIIWTFDHFTPVTSEDIEEVIPLLRPGE
jgi:diadenosine tetraphosphate (Ap4A) HIT family hydrolase